MYTKWGVLNMSKTLKISLCILLILVLIGVLVFGIYKYIHRWDPENFIGLTAEQIMDRYGEFYGCLFWDTTGNYRRGVYLVKPERVGYFGTDPEEYFVIEFDENGVAYKCKYEIGGKGG